MAKGTATQKNLVFSIFDEGVGSDQDDLIAKPNACKEVYNFDVTDGSLCTGMGFSDFRALADINDMSTLHPFKIADSVDEICGIWFDRWFVASGPYYRYQVLMADSANVLWGVPLLDEYNGYVWKRADQLKSYPTCVTQYHIGDEDCILIFTKEGMLMRSMTKTSFYPNVPALISNVVHYDKVFGIVNNTANTLVYTSNKDLSTWSEQEKQTVEFMDNRGAFLRLISLNDYVYLFREHGIMKISIYTSSANFSFTHMYTSSSRIYEDSIAVAGGKIFFASRDGLFVFNGNSVSKVCEKFDKYFANLDNSHCSGACINGKYYLASHFDFGDEQKIGCEATDGFVNNILFEVDTEDYSVNITRGIDIRQLLAVDTPEISRLVACFYNKNKQHLGELSRCGADFDDVTQKLWRSFKTDLGFVGKRKVIKRLTLTTKYPCQVEISSDEESKTYEFDGSEFEQQIPVKIYGAAFEFVFKTSDQFAKISKPSIIFDVKD